MNKLIVLSVLVFFIIGCILVSASVISGDSSKEKAAENVVPQTEYVAKTDPSTIQDMTNLSQRITNNLSDINNLSNRVSRLEENHEDFSDRLYDIEKSSSQVQNTQDNKSLKCEITGYLNLDNSPVSPTQANSAALQDDLQAGRKKLSLVCSY